MCRIALLDACVLYQAHLRDYLLYMTLLKCFKPRWTERINDEWIQNLLLKRPDLSPQSFERLRLLLRKNFPQANIKGYEPLMDGLLLPDKDDHHVLAAAIRGRADCIVTFNIRDFPDTEFAKHSLSAIHPDLFLTALIEKTPAKAVQAFMNQVEHLRKPPVSAGELLEKFARTDLQQTARILELLLKNFGYLDSE